MQSLRVSHQYTCPVFLLILPTGTLYDQTLLHHKHITHQNKLSSQHKAEVLRWMYIYNLRTSFDLTTVASYFPFSLNLRKLLRVVKSVFVTCDSYLRAEGKYLPHIFFYLLDKNLILSAILWTKMGRPRLAADWNSGERCAANCRAKRS